MGYAEVAVSSPLGQGRTFSYSIPSRLQVGPGQAVWVPFGKRVLQGIVFELTDHPEVAETRDILSIIREEPVLSPSQIQLARWMSSYYLSSLFACAAPMLPPGFEQSPAPFISLRDAAAADRAFYSLSAEQKQLLELLRRKGKVAVRQVERLLGKKKAADAVAQLLQLGLLVKAEQVQRSKVRARLVPHVRLAVSAEAAEAEAQRVERRAPRQAAFLRFLAAQPLPVTVAAAGERAGSAAATASALQKRGLVHIEAVRLMRDPLGHRDYPVLPAPALIPAQEQALQEVRRALQEAAQGKEGGQVFLLHGITGSGKTEVYLQALAQAVALGRRGIVLVPEISLTPQTIERFASRFPGRVAVLHSKLSAREQYDEWESVRSGAFDVVIGPRSAVFAPQQRLGIIIVDEEHEWTYKQREQAPRYHARDVACKLAELTGAVVLLGSATPSIETYYQAEAGAYRLLELPERIVPAGAEQGALSEVKLVDLRRELKEGNRSIFSRALRQALAEVLAQGEQAILFLNRRGMNTFVQCRDCGYVARCRRCDLPLTYHAAGELLVCHQCNYRRRSIVRCPQCLSRRIRLLGAGTERVEQEMAQAFPGARLLRWDRDVTAQWRSHEGILEKFRRHEADVLIGTQMVAKGLDLPSVTLVGVISADTILHFPDFRSGERTFQVLSQVAGRAGRGIQPGHVIVQTYTPEHYAIAAASSQDFKAFYRREIELRREYEHPPFSRLASLVYGHAKEESCRREAEKVAGRIKEMVLSLGLAGLDVIGPAPPFFARVRGKYRWQIVLRGRDLPELLAGLSLPAGWVVDVDPVSLL